MNRSRPRFLASVVTLAALAGALPGCKSDQKKTKDTAAAAAAVPEKPLSVEESARVKATARVTAIDHTTRKVTLEDAQGRTYTLVAGSEVRRLNEVHPGDSVTVEYVVSLLAELRPATAEETASPITAVEIAGRAGQDSAPAAGAARGVKVVTTVQEVDQPRMLVTLRGPGGDVVTVRGRKPENVARLKVGDTVVITYTESLVVALEKNVK